MTINSILEEVNLAKNILLLPLFFWFPCQRDCDRTSDIDIAVSGIPDTENLREELDNLQVLN